NEGMTTIYYSRARERALQAVDEPRAGSWIVSVAPDEAELDALAEHYGLDRDNLTDAVDIYEAPRVEIDDGAVYIYTRYCYPEGTEIATEPLLIIYTADYLICVQRASTPILERLTTDVIDVVTTQKTKTLLQIFAEINRSYEAQARKVSRQILQIRAHMRQARITTREFVGIIELEEDLNEFLSALQPQALLFSSLLSGKYLRLYEEDRDIIEDIERSTSELITQVQGRLRTLVNMRQAYDAIATNNLNNTFKRLTSIAIFLAIPTVISGMWGENLGVPFKDTTYGFWIITGFIVACTAGAIWIFRRKRWL
ncbi:MAG TPA: magnesium transporter CorA family protein, partial [Candidatus Saccharimonadales bacterium]|nr:magnesium transporter CorA family protein [Candidatus Saccharimonadales bacterium]